MSCSNTPMFFLDEDKFNSERLLALNYIKERVERASTVHNILAPITSQEYIFDVARADDNFSDVSELSDPFAELGGNIILSAENKQKRRLSKVEADVLIMNSFPSTHMEIQNGLVAERRLSHQPHMDIEAIMNATSEDGDDNESDIFQHVTCALDQVGLKVYKEEKRKNDEKEKARQKQRPKRTRTQDELDLEANSMLSGIWRMLDATSVENDGFPITQPGYNFYEDKRTLVDPTERTWNQKEEVRKKCEDWLKTVK